MRILEKFKALFYIPFNKSLIDIKINTGNIFVSNKEYKYNEEESKLEIFLNNMSSKRKEELIKLILESIEVDDKRLFKEGTIRSLNSIREYNESHGKDRQIKNFFKNIIPLSDYEALEASLYLRREFNKREDEANIKKLKKDIFNKFGERGKNISNLCTAGYFEGFFVPLYNDNKTKPEKFKEIYEEVVGKGILTVFVYEDMDEKEIANQIKNKIEISKKYGMPFINIHGIGKTNIEKIKNFIETQKDFLDFFEKKIIYEKGDILILKLSLKKIIKP